MAGPFPYKPGYGSTPAPAGDVTFGWQGRTEMVAALMDSGASGTTIPETLVSKLQLRKIGEINARGYNGQPELRGMYSADIAFLGFTFNKHPVMAVPRPYALIGRDILNRYKTTLDGPLLQFIVQ